MKNKFKLTCALLVLSICFVFFTGCKKEMLVNSLSLDKNQAVIKVGTTFQLEATADVENAEDYQIEWTSSDNAIATVNQTGKITALASGNTTITATLGDKTVSADICIVNAIVESNGNIQNAIDSAQNGDVIYVSNGTYNQSITINNKNITITGGDETKICGPEDYNDIGTINAIAEESVNYSAIVSIVDSNVTLKNIAVEGIPEKTNNVTNLTHTNRYIGIASINSTTILDKITVSNIKYTESLRGMQNGFGIYCVATDANKTITIKNSTVLMANKCSLIVRNNLSKATITDNSFIGNGEQNIIAENGLQIACPAEIKNNTIKNYKYNSENEWAHGSYAILIQSTGANSVDITGNTFDNVDNGIYAYTAGSVTGGKTSVESSNTFTNLYEWQVEEGKAVNKFEEAI